MNRLLLLITLLLFCSLSLAPHTAAQGLNCSNAATDPYEPNDTCGTASVLLPGLHTGMFVGTGLQGPFDLDFHRIEVPQGMQAIVQPQLYGASSDARYRLYWDCQSGPFKDQVSVNPLTFLYPNGTSGADSFLLEIQAWGWSDTFCQDYDLEYSLEPSPCAGGGYDYAEPNNVCVEATSLGVGAHEGLVSSLGDVDLYALRVPAGQYVYAVAIDNGRFHEVELYLRFPSVPECGMGPGGNDLNTLDHLNVQWINQTGSEQDVILEVHTSPSSAIPCAEYALIVSSPPPAGPSIDGSFCVFKSLNSELRSTVISGAFSAPGGSGLHLEARQGPPGQFGYFIASEGYSQVGVQISKGFFCLSTAPGYHLGRYNWAGTVHNSTGQFDAQGILQNQFSNSSVGSGFDVPLLSPATGGALTAGVTHYFQLWHRDVRMSSNWSNGLAVTF